MKNKLPIAFAVIFWLIVAVDMIGVTYVPLLHFIAKPLLIPALLLLLINSTTTAAQKKLLLTGLVFSWAGDMFLLFQKNNALFFIFGLVCFLITHIFYIIYFLQIRSPHISLLKKMPLLIVLVIAYGISLVGLLFPHLAQLKIPVTIYAAVICTMLLCSMHIFLKVNTPSNNYFLWGAILFVLSDSSLAINQFYTPFAFAGVLIMLTYCAAQYFIVTGFIKQTTP